jgi:hypothetical protein
VQRVSLIVASLPGGNPGMLAANRAAVETLGAITPHVTVYEAVRRRAQGDGVPARELLASEDAARSADRIVFWGDWLHMHNYLVALADDAGRMLEPPPRPVSYDDVRAALLMEGLAEERLRDVAIVGTTLALDGPAARIGPGYSDSLRRLHANAGLVRMRDSFSAGLVETWRGGRDSCGGLDAAFLYRARAAEGVAERDSDEGPVAGYFIGRTSRPSIPKVSAFTRELVRGLGAEPRWIPWIARPFVALDEDAPRRRVPRGLGRLLRSSQPPAPGPVAPEAPLDDLVDQVRACDVVITDTYHLAVIAWGHGVPCVLFGEASNANTKRINGGRRFEGYDKRLAMLATLDAVPFYVPIEDLSDPAIATARVAHLVEEVLNTSHLTDHVLATIDTRRSALVGALRSWLTG